MWKGNWIPEKGERSRDSRNYCEESSKVISEDHRGFLRLMTDSPAKASQLKDSAVGRREVPDSGGGVERCRGDSLQRRNEGGPRR